MGKILIAGGAVPFAGWLAKELLEAGHTVRVTATSAPTNPLPQGVEFVHCQLDHTDTYVPYLVHLMMLVVLSFLSFFVSCLFL